MKYMVQNIFPVLMTYRDRDPLKSFFPKVEACFQAFVTESKNVMTTKYATYFAEWMQDTEWVNKLKRHDLTALEEHSEIQACYIPQIMSLCFQASAREDAWGYIDNIIRSMEWKSDEHQDQLDQVTGIALELMQSIKDQKQNIHSVQDVQGVMNKILQKMQTNDGIRAQLKNLFRNLDNKSAMDSLVAFLGKLDPSNGKSQASIATKEVLQKIQEGMNPPPPSS
jgi:ATP-dependent Lon protease